MAVKVNFTLPEDLLERLKNSVPHRERSSFVATALRQRLAEVEREQSQLRADTTKRRVTMTSPGNRRTVIDTSFTMDIGETVVVGTSRLQGDKALIALLTAVASTKPALR